MNIQNKTRTKPLQTPRPLYTKGELQISLKFLGVCKGFTTS